MKTEDAPGPAPTTVLGKIAAFITKDRLIKAGLLLAVILAGAVNRVTFKIMQFSMMNYSYFISQFTTFVYIPVNFIAIAFKLWCTNHITQEQRSFPKYKFFVMGFLDSVQGLFVVVGGVKVPGVMQNLLLQGAVPVTMICSLLFLRNRGCDQCKEVRSLLDKHKIKYREESTQPEACGESGCLCSVSVGSTKYTGGQVKDMGESVESLLAGSEVVLSTSGRSWLQHLKSYYKWPQYVGAVIILGGLVVSVWPSLSGSGQGGGPVMWDFVFFLATVPMALSAVYKQIAFESIDLDVWWLNGWVAIYQFVVGLTYAPLAAVMTGLPTDQIRGNIWDGLRCFLIGTNFITSNCSTAHDCGDLLPCCDSCDGSIPSVSAIAARWAVLMYMGANIFYNVMLVLVIKYFDAAMMYVASTVVLPLGAVCFTIHAFLGDHAQPFDKFNGVGLGVVLAGLICYRFVAAAVGGKLGPVSTTGVLAEPVLTVHAPTVTVKPRTVHQIRSTFMSRMGVGVPRTARRTPPVGLAPAATGATPVSPARTAPVVVAHGSAESDHMPPGSMEMRQRGLLLDRAAGTGAGDGGAAAAAAPAPARPDGYSRLDD